MQPLNLRFNVLIPIILLGLFSGCGDHSTPKVTDNTGTPLINLTSGPYEVVVAKSLSVGIETKSAANTPVYKILPVPTGIAIVNEIFSGHFVITGIKPGTTTFTITDQANPLATARTINVTVKAAPSLEIKPDTVSGRVGQSILLSIATLNPENEAKHTLLIEDTSVARIIDSVNNPNLIDLIKVGTTKVIVQDTNNSLTKDVTINVTP